VSGWGSAKAQTPSNKNPGAMVPGLSLMSMGSSVQGRGATLFQLNNDCGVHRFQV
jgi:hypothetical protein